MANCSVQTGFLFWKKQCIHPSLGNCARCRRFVCQIHSQAQRDGTLLCDACSPSDTDEDFGNESELSLGGLAGAIGGAGSAPADSGSGDSASNDSSSDSGSGDSGGASSD